MLPKKHRLSKNEEIVKVVRGGKYIWGKTINIKFLANKHNSGLSRFTFIVSNKIAKKAVERNKIKRRLREAVREHIGNIQPGYDVVITARPEIINKNHSDIKQEIAHILSKARLLSRE